ncbi:unnamed protein product [Ambrosiozyma monospora]|uniref:Unnamed protein product n=1 Tax=Ambrosiozyma monospora TaxID=43982 RepID=A0ACB5T3Q1_AMBMO|nr:unnamed protein product [Ambrosiozyma monospora]
MQKLPSGAYFVVGEVNSGKSSLVKSMIALDKKGFKSGNRFGPGVSPLPCFTRSEKKYRLSTVGLTLIDTPGFAPRNKGVYGTLLKEYLNKVPKVYKAASDGKNGHKCVPLDIKQAKRFNGERVFSVGGLFFLRPPSGNVFKIRQSLIGEQAIYKNIEKVFELSSTRPKAVAKQFAVSHDAILKMKRFVIPPFYGNIDLVVKGAGFVTISPTSSKENGGLYQLYVPDGVEILVRESIFNFIYKMKVRPEKEQKEGKTHPTKKLHKMRSVNNKKLVFTELYPVEMNLSDAEAFQKVVPYSVFSSNSTAKSQEEFRNEYWKQPSLK